jgi:sugar/nucleoside kinase (ribokinase family)
MDLQVREQLAQDTAAKLRDAADRLAKTPVLIGFDGFVDAIIRVVDQRADTENYTALPDLTSLGKRILESAGESSNMELVVTQEKLGGNGPIMANAMLQAGLPVSYVGALGTPTVHPVFADFDEQADVHSISEPGLTDALEFDDGKLMLGKHGTLGAVNQQTIDDVIGREAYTKLIGRSALIGMVNWTMLTRLESIWRALIDDVLPAVGPEVQIDGRAMRRKVFIDLADPAKRTREDIKRAMGLCTELADQADVVLGLNLSEASQVAGVVGVAIDGEPESQIQTTAQRLRETLKLHAVVVHPRRGAAAAIEQPDGSVATGSFAGPFVEKPKLSTGAGDNFNAGFCLGLLAGLGVEGCLCTGVGTSGYYVRNAASPTLTQLAEFCGDLPAPQA